MDKKLELHFLLSILFLISIFKKSMDKIIYSWITKFLIYINYLGKKIIQIRLLQSNNILFDNILLDLRKR